MKSNQDWLFRSSSPLVAVSSAKFSSQLLTRTHTQRGMKVYLTLLAINLFAGRFVILLLILCKISASLVSSVKLPSYLLKQDLHKTGVKSVPNTGNCTSP